MGRENGLTHSQAGDVRHLPQALQCSFARIGELSGVLFRGEIAGGKAGVVVSGAYQPIEVILARWHITVRVKPPLAKRAKRYLRYCLVRAALFVAEQLPIQTAGRLGEALGSWAFWGLWRGQGGEAARLGTVARDECPRRFGYRQGVLRLAPDAVGGKI